MRAATSPARSASTRLSETCASSFTSLLAVRKLKHIPRSHLSPGRSFQTNQQHIHDLVPYLQGGKKHDFGHEIHSFSFGSETEDEFVGMGGKKAKDVKKALGIVNPLDGIKAHTEESN